MKITIIAATGGVGRQLVGQALASGHDVTAVARNPAKLPPDVLAAGTARVIAADLARPDPQVLESAVAGADAVLSALGPHNNSDAGIAAPGTKAITDAMRAAGVRRIVAISAAPVGTTPSPGRPHPPRHDPGEGFFMRHVGTRIAKIRRTPAARIASVIALVPGAAIPASELLCGPSADSTASAPATADSSTCGSGRARSAVMTRAAPAASTSGGSLAGLRATAVTS